MGAARAKQRATARQLGWLLAAGAVVAVAAGAGPGRKRAAAPADVEGRALFVKAWEPGQPSPTGGDGLGPYYNERSCVACHRQGGVGGGGPNENNVRLLSLGAPPMVDQGPGLFKGEPEQLHPGLRNHASVVLHRSSTDPKYEDWLKGLGHYVTVQTRDDLIGLVRSERNTPALFGAGRIDEIPEQALIDAAARTDPRFPEVKGRVSRLKDGRVGRFGWKGQTANLRDFVLAACSNELGLEVPGHHQVVLASDVDPAGLKLDLDAAECTQLTSFVADLPAPWPKRAVLSPAAERGREAFGAIGCAACHAPRLGPVAGIYSDLLLHDLGDRSRDFGFGYGMPASPGGVVDRATLATGGDRSGPAGPNEWRTPPLWGVADSAPYLHDGRAADLDTAVRLHGGEAAATAGRYARLSRFDRAALLRFLGSLTQAKPGTKPRAQPEAGRGRSPNMFMDRLP